MGRKLLGQKPLTQAEKQRRYRASQKQKIENLQIEALKMVSNVSIDLDYIRENVKTELKTSWEPELKQALIAEQKKKGRELAKKSDQSYSQGKTAGICSAAAFFIGRDRADITQALLSHFCIGREAAEAVLQADKRVKNLTLESLDKAGAWEEPIPTIK